MIVRVERPEDRSGVRLVNELAFGRVEEADIVDELRAPGSGYLGFVAVDPARDNQVVGHIAFTKATVATAPTVHLMGLAPMAVLPDLQKHRIGSSLVHAGIDACQRGGAHAIVVLGHPSYYPRLGFERADEYGLCCEYDVEPGAFMVLPLDRDALANGSGLVVYHTALR